MRPESLRLAPHAPFAITIALVLDPALGEARYEEGDYRIALGDLLRTHAEEVARACFARVVSASAGSEHPAILTMRLIAHLPSLSLWAGQDQVHTILLEWTLRDPNGRLIWIETVRGEAQGPMGTATSQDDKAASVVRASIRDAMVRSNDVMEASPEIAGFTASSRGAADGKPSD